MYTREGAHSAASYVLSFVFDKFEWCCGQRLAGNKGRFHVPVRNLMFSTAGRREELSIWQTNSDKPWLRHDKASLP